MQLYVGGNDLRMYQHLCQNNRNYLPTYLPNLLTYLLTYLLTP